MAVTLIRALQAKGRRYPVDFKVVGYDGTFVSKLPYPSLSTIVQPIEELASTCVDVLIERINGKTPELKNIELDVTFRQGESTKSFNR